MHKYSDGVKYPAYVQKMFDGNIMNHNINTRDIYGDFKGGKYPFSISKGENAYAVITCSNTNHLIEIK